MNRASTGAVMMTVMDETLFYLFCGILITMLQHRDLSTLEESGIRQTSVPSCFIKQFISSYYLSLEFQTQSEMIDRFTVIRIRIPLLQHFDSLLQIGLCLYGLSVSDKP